MAELINEHPDNKPALGTTISVELRNNGLFVLDPTGDAWLQFHLMDSEKRRLLKVLLKDFIDGVLP